MHTENSLVTVNDIPLSDDDAIRERIEPLGLPHVHPDELRRVGAQDGESPLPYWARHLSPWSTLRKWHENTDVWLQVNEKDGVLRRVLISGLSDEEEAKIVRSEFRRRRASVSELAGLVAEVVESREERAYQRTFQSCLQRVRSFFEWDNGRIIESEGLLTGLPIGSYNLKAQDLALLRDVFALLPRPLHDEEPDIKLQDAVCPACGATPRPKREIINNLKAARKKVEEHSTKFKDEGFKAWLGERVQDKAEKWMRPTALYDDYASWIRTRGENRGERSEAKRTAMSQKKWGALMRKSYDYRRDGSGGFYRAALKRQ